MIKLFYNQVKWLAIVFWHLLKMIELCINLDVSFYFVFAPPVTLEQVRKLD